MAETVIGMFPQSQQAEDVVPMLANRGYSQCDVEKLGGATLSSGEADMIDKLADLGVVEVGQLESLVNVINHGGIIIAARTQDHRKASQVEELMLDHGATRCLYTGAAG